MFSCRFFRFHSALDRREYRCNGCAGIGCLVCVGEAGVSRLGAVVVVAGSAGEVGCFDAEKKRRGFSRHAGSIRPMGRRGRRGGSAEGLALSSALPSSARMSPHQVIPWRVASLQRSLLFRLVSLFRIPQRISSSHTYKDKRYWPLSWRMIPCCAAWVIASCAVRLEHCVRFMISSRSWL
jgi:hypothetical protein